MHNTEGLRRDKNGGSTHCLRLIQEPVRFTSKSNLESDYLIVQFIYEFSRVKGISYIVSGRRGLGIGYVPKEIDMYHTYKTGVSVE